MCVYVNFRLVTIFNNDNTNLWNSTRIYLNSTELCQEKFLGLIISQEIFILKLITYFHYRKMNPGIFSKQSLNGF